MALKCSTHIQRAVAARSEVLAAALPAARVSSRPIASMRQAVPFTSVQPSYFAKNVLRKAAASRALSVKVAAVNGSGLKVDLRGEKTLMLKACVICTNH